MAKKILVDTGFWIALFYERDQHHDAAQKIEDILAIHTILVPWPTLFEFVDTRFSRRNGNAQRFRQFLHRPSTILIDDAPYRDESLIFTLGEQQHTFSLTDHIMRSMIMDVEISIDAFLGFNHKDFYDVCGKRRIEMIDVE